MTQADRATDIVVYDDMGPCALRGWKIAEVSLTYADAAAMGHSRWTDLFLYKVAGDPEVRYAVQITGRSSVYHRQPGPCRAGVSLPVGRLGDDDERYQALTACRTCSPPDLDDLKDSDFVKVEVSLPRLYRCRTADFLVRTLYRHDRRSADSPPSKLSVKLLMAAAETDPYIKQALMRVPRA